MRTIFMLLPIAALAGCATSASVQSSNAGASVAAFDAAETVAAGYLRLPVCPTASPSCRTQALSVQTARLIRSGRTARAAVEAQLVAGQPVTANIGNLQGYVSALQAVEAEYAR